MKKHLLKVLTLLMAAAVLLCACGDGKGAADSGAQESWQKQLISKDKLMVGMCSDYPPYESLNASGEIEGFDVDMAKELAELMGLELEIKQMEFSQIVTAVQMGQVDIGVSAFAYKADRDVLFSDPYIETDQVMVVTKNSGITQLSQLAGKKIGAGTGTSCEEAAMKAVPEGVFSNPGDYNIMFAALQSGAIDAVACNDQVAKGYISANDDLAQIEEIMATEGTHVIAMKGHDDLMGAVNEAIGKYMGSSAYTTALEKWEIGQE